jgi:D-alanyl-lipoteichoic acid acyltransferase DltB (MBOAT superfamily)
LGGSKSGKWKAVRNTFIIFLVSGFWHGASWNFIAWGFIHACGFIPLLLLNKNRKHVTDIAAQFHCLPNIRELWQMTTTFTFVTLAWIFFRADGIFVAFSYIRKIIISITVQPSQLLELLTYKNLISYILTLLLGDWYLRRHERSLKAFENRTLNWILYIIISCAVVFTFLDHIKAQEFIYFQF